jgi:hypothetical protein
LMACFTRLVATTNDSLTTYVTCGRCAPAHTTNQAQQRHPTSSSA